MLLRHGESLWNKENRFSGWADVDLSGHGKIEARKAGETLKSEGYFFDIAYTSVLKRAIRTLWNGMNPTKFGTREYAVKSIVLNSSS